MPSINIVAVLLAGIAGWLVGAVWYGILGKPWMQALGWSEAEIKGPRAVPVTAMIVAFVAQIVMALGLAGVLGHIGAITLMGGIVAGLASWLTFVVTVLSVNYSFQKRPVMLILIDGGHWLAVLLIQGIVLGLMG